MADPATLLLVEDNESVVDALTTGLSKRGFIVYAARDGREAVEQFDVVEPNMVLLDVMLPGLSGLDVCRTIRRKSSVPIIMLSARSAEVDLVVGLEVGADDYIAKPYSMRELIARINALLRRSAAAELSGGITEVGDIRLDADHHEVTIKGEPVVLTLKEFLLLEVLMKNAGRVLSRDNLISRVWGNNYVGDSKTLDVHIRRLRSKLEPDQAHPRLITTMRGLGYRFDHADQ